MNTKRHQCRAGHFLVGKNVEIVGRRRTCLTCWPRKAEAPKRKLHSDDVPPGADLRWPDWVAPILRELPLKEWEAHDLGAALGLHPNIAANATIWMENEGLAALTDANVLVITQRGWRFIRDHYMHADCGCEVCLRQRDDHKAATAWLREVMGVTL